jgi:AsmA family protein
LLVIAALAGAEWAGWPFLRRPLERQLSSVANVPVTIATPFRIRMLGSPTLQAGQLRVAAADGTSAPFLLEASNVVLGLRWGDLWAAAHGGGVRVRDLRADSLQAHLMRSADGHANWQIGAKWKACRCARPASK